MELIATALEAARRAVSAAGQIQRQGMNSRRQIEHKGRYDLVTDVDRQSEQAVLEILHAAMPQSRILAEETTNQVDPDEGLVWVVDPLDGTTNYAHGFPMFCVSLALRENGRTLIGMVYDPLRDERFEAACGQGARLNGAPIQVSETADLSRSLLATGFPYDRLEKSTTNLDRFAAMTMRTRGVRRSGSAALDLCYTACGRLDGYWEIRLNPWDIAAGILIVQEAGGRVTDFRGGPVPIQGSEILATNTRLHDALMASLHDPWPGTPCFN